jgi:hypothetical protein
MMLKSMMTCERTRVSFTRRDSFIGAGVMICGTLAFSVLGIFARRHGWPVTGEVLMSQAFLGPLMLSMPFWLMKGQSRKAQVVIVGAMLALLVAISYLAAII